MKNLTLVILTSLFLVTQSCKKEEPDIQLQIEESEMIDSRDGQKYKIVKIGSQWWMAENLNYHTTIGSWYYNNDSIQYSTVYGRLYLYETIMLNNLSSETNPSGVQGISPIGWHIPSYSEWRQLEEYLSSFGLDANALKESGTAHWKPTNQGTNIAKFNAVPAGTVYNDGSNFANINGFTTLLSSTLDSNIGGALGVGFSDNNFNYAPIGLQNGWSLRCVKD
jgi:uncharacterized protein (TIGR02145 family)